MGSTQAPEWQRGGLEQMEAPVNNPIHEKMGVTGPWMCLQIKHPTRGGWGSAGRWRINEPWGGGDFLFIPCHNPEVKAFIPYKMHAYNIYRRVRCTNVDNYPWAEWFCGSWDWPHSCCRNEYKRGWTSHWNSLDDQTDSINLSQIRLRVPLDGLHHFDLIIDGVIDCI